jgi:hydroxymethylbilane synthase
MSAALRLGTRRSLMATTQSQQVADALTARTGRAVELVGVTTEGDVSRAQLAQLGGTGVFVGALRERLLAGEIDFAVHSLKDLPTGPADGIALAAIPGRDDPRDALCSALGAAGPIDAARPDTDPDLARTDPARAGAAHTLAGLAAGARVGTGSPRRMAQLRVMRRDLTVLPIRGNADTRLDKTARGEFDAVVLAYAGLVRIGRQDTAGEVFGPDRMLPAPGQGALAVECRADRAELVDLLGVLDDPVARTAVTAERAVLAELSAGCSAPVGAYAEEHDQKLHLTAAVVALDGSAQVRLSVSGHPGQAERLGRDLAGWLLAEGADQLMGEHVP